MDERMVVSKQELKVIEAEPQVEACGSKILVPFGKIKNLGKIKTPCQVGDGLAAASEGKKHGK